MINKAITYSGKFIDIFNLSIEDIDIIDIAYGLSNIPRFAGQVPFYSVAKHSLFVASKCPIHLKLSGLLHDASEAYIGDMISPIKNKIPEYMLLEKKILNTIAKKWNLDPYNPIIKEIDKDALKYEKSILFFQNSMRTEDQSEIMNLFLTSYHTYYLHKD